MSICNSLRFSILFLLFLLSVFLPIIGFLEWIVYDCVTIFQADSLNLGSFHYDQAQVPCQLFFLL